MFDCRRRQQQSLPHEMYLILYNELHQRDSYESDSAQCDQMARLFFIILSFITKKIYPKT